MPRGGAAWAGMGPGTKQDLLSNGLEDLTHSFRESRFCFFFLAPPPTLILLTLLGAHSE